MLMSPMAADIRHSKRQRFVTVVAHIGTAPRRGKGRIRGVNETCAKLASRSAEVEGGGHRLVVGPPEVEA
jgi:hypothetical protein